MTARPRAIVPFVLLGSVLAWACVAGCANAHRGGSRSPYEPIAEGARNTAEAERLTGAAVDALPSDPVKAERLLREALAADLYHGPAHNNLGVIYLESGRLYEAAGEFEWARKLMPGHPDPRLNLALTLEQAGRVDEALDAYGAALEVQPGHLPSMQGLARLQVRAGRSDGRTDALLAEIALRGETDEWRAWARRQAARLER